MVETKRLFGFKPVRVRGQAYHTGGESRYPIASGYASNIFTGDLVRTSAGTLKVYVCTSDVIAGVFMGCEYERDGKVVQGKYWPSGTSATNAFAHVVDDSDVMFLAQIDSSISVADLYGSTNFGVTLGTGSTFSGQSGFGIKAAGRSTKVGAIRVFDPYDIPGNESDTSAGKEHMIVHCQIINHKDRFIDTLSIN